MKNFFTFLIAVSLPFLLVANTSQFGSSVTADLQQEMQAVSASEQLRINIRLTQQYDLTEFESIRQYMTREQRRDYVVNELKAFASQTQSALLNELETFKNAGEVSQIQALWITNVINCYATPSVIEQLAQRPNINRIDIDEERILIDPIDVEEVGETQIREITYNVSIMNVPEVWEMGFTGEDVVVAVLDSGVNYNHNDLTNNMWEHPDFPFHGWNFTNNSNNPMDFHGHGTHCAGTVAGDGTSGSQTGMAPTAKIMALQVLTASGGGTESGVWAAIQFGVEYGADVLSLSLGWAHAWGPDRASWRSAMDNALAAGVVASVAVGNEGNQQGTYPIPSNIRTPGDCPAPWRHPDQPDTGTRSAVVSVGATNSSDVIANFSSRGPVTWQNISPYNDYEYNPGQGLILPDVVAPGVSVKSCSHTNISGYTTMSGTSMATPGVAGVMALILSKNPNVTPELMSQILEETALPLSSSKSNTYGSGRVDALEAIINTPFMGPIYSSHSINDEAGNNNGQINPSEFIKVNLALENNSEQSFSDVEAYVYNDSPYITMIDTIAFFGDFGPEETIELADAFSFQVADNIPGSHQLIFRLEATDGNDIWKSEFTALAAAPRLVIQNVTIDDSEGNNNGKLDPGENVIISIQTLNSGQVIATDPVASLESSSPFIYIQSDSQQLASIPPFGNETVSFELNVSEATPLAEPVLLTYTITTGAYIVDLELYLRVSELVEDFETGDFTQFEWLFSGAQPWTLVSTGTYEGAYSARSGNINHNQFSQMVLEVEVAQDDHIEFMYKVSSEPDYDFLRFYIGTNLMGEWSGTVDWQLARFPVSKGEHILSWVYVKDGGVSQGSDAAWVDYIVLPQPVTTTAFAGQDAIICVGQDFPTEAIIMNAVEILWETSGDGMFTEVDVENPIYMPGEMDIDNGMVELVVSIVGEDGAEKSDQMMLSIYPEVEAIAGDDKSICLGSVLLIDDAYAQNHEHLTWSTSGSGEFEQMHMLETTYIPSEEDYEAGMVEITLIASGPGYCEDVYSSFNLVFSPEPEIEVGADMDVCSNQPVMLNAMASNYVELLWSSSGSGSFEDEGSLEAIYHPGLDDIMAGTVNISLTAIGAQGCQEVTDELTVFFIQAPSVEIMGDTEICEGNQAEVTLQFSGTGPWEVDLGEGFDEITSDESTYLLSLDPDETSTYIIYSLADASGCAVHDAAEFTISVLTVPQAPAMPVGPDDVDYVETTTTSYITDEVELADAYVWQLTPESAGEIVSDGKEVEIQWNTDFIGQADLSVRAIGVCGESLNSEALNITLKNTIGLDEIAGINRIAIYPNPSSGLVNLEFNITIAQEIDIVISNQLGQVVHKFTKETAVGPMSETIDLSQLNNGIYLINISGNSGSVIKRVMINK